MACESLYRPLKAPTKSSGITIWNTTPSKTEKSFRNCCVVIKNTAHRLGASLTWKASVVIAVCGLYNSKIQCKGKPEQTMHG